MRVFISWSGGRSHRLARVMKEWLEECFSGQGISAFVSSEIPKGSLWFSAVNVELQQADAGLVCLTAQSLHSEWVLFEAGALSTAVTGTRVNRESSPTCSGWSRVRCAARCRPTSPRSPPWRTRSG